MIRWVPEKGAEGLKGVMGDTHQTTYCLLSDGHHQEVLLTLEHPCK